MVYLNYCLMSWLHAPVSSSEVLNLGRLGDVGQHLRRGNRYV